MRRVLKDITKLSEVVDTETRTGKIEVEFSGWTSLEIRGKKVFVDDYIFPRISRYLKRNHKDLIYDLFE